MLHNMIAITALVIMLVHITPNNAQVCADFSELSDTCSLVTALDGPCCCCAPPNFESCQPCPTPEPTTAAPTTAAPTTAAPTTAAPTTAAPTTAAPTITTATITTCVCPDDSDSSDSISATSISDSSEDSSSITATILGTAMATGLSDSSDSISATSLSDSSDSSSIKAGCICTTTPVPTELPVDSDSDSESESASSESSESSEEYDAAHVAANVIDDVEANTEDDGHYTMNIAFSDATLMNIWGLFGLLMLANMLCCYMCRKNRNTRQKVMEQDEDGGSRLDVMA